MTVYTVHIPPGVSDPTLRADRTVFLREGFSLGAFVFGWFFLVWHRLWMAAIVWLVLAGLIAGFGYAVHAQAGFPLALLALMHLFVGVEGFDIRRWQLERHRFRMADVVTGSAREEAEYAFFHRQPEDAERTGTALPSRIVARDTTPAVIGMFPDENGR